LYTSYLTAGQQQGRPAVLQAYHLDPASPCMDFASNAGAGNV
jgi:hypothetical protein